MKNPPILIKKIAQKDNFTFSIEWSDGIVNDYRLSRLQERCPCAKCYDPQAHKQLVGKENLDEQVKAVRVTNVGRYALRVQFSSGCSKGIYSYAMLREIAKGAYHV